MPWPRTATTNPPTLAPTPTRHQAIANILSQLCGACVGALLLWGTSGLRDTGLGANSVGTDYTNGNAVLGEIGALSCRACVRRRPACPAGCCHRLRRARAGRPPPGGKLHRRPRPADHAPALPLPLPAPLATAQS